MTIREINKAIKGVFKLPIKKYHIGRQAYGTPYFNPRNFSPSIIRIKKVTKKSDEEINKLTDWGRTIRSNIYNLPMVLRSKFWVIKLFGNYYWIEIGWPIAIRTIDLGWKDKFDTPRFEWNPSFQIWFFKWQFCIHWKAPIENEDTYWEMVLWYLRYANKDINKARDTWPWRQYDTKQSTWNDECLNLQYLVQY